MGRPVHTVTWEARTAMRDYAKRNRSAHKPLEEGEWRVLQTSTRNDGGLFVMGIYKRQKEMYGRIVERSLEGLRTAIVNATGRRVIVEIMYEESEP